VVTNVAIVPPCHGDSKPRNANAPARFIVPGRRSFKASRGLLLLLAVAVAGVSTLRLIVHGRVTVLALLALARVARVHTVFVVAVTVVALAVAVGRRGDLFLFFLFFGVAVLDGG